jgi:outer membrane protein OmpA-like peptidoglycan-associated protein
MRKKSILVVLAVALGGGVTSAQVEQADAKGCKDNALFTRMPGSFIYNCSEQTFAAHEFSKGTPQATTVEGHLWRMTYYPQATQKTKPSELQILRNFENAMTKVGAKVLPAAKSRGTYRLIQDGRELWIDVWAEFTGKYGFFIVEKQAMVQDVVANAAALGNDLKTSGHVTVDGILFDTGKATIKPESAKAIGEVAKLLNGDPALKVYVVGHTDTTGVLDANMRLSQERAEAVAQALVATYSIAAARLKAFGNGPYAPVASNDAEAGRARNRRVELVKQ